jgi:Fe2+ transport system protein FeoA
MLDSVVNVCDGCNTLGSQSRVSLVRLGLHRGAESVVVVDQQLQARQNERCKTRFLEVGVLGDENVDIVRDADVDCVDDFVEDLAGVGLIELGCEVGVDEALAVG